MGRNGREIERGEVEEEKIHGCFDGKTDIAAPLSTRNLAPDKLHEGKGTDAVVGDRRDV